MNKKELAKKLASKVDIGTNAMALQTITAIIDIVKEELKTGNPVDIVGFGKFITTLQKGKSGKVPGTNKTYTTQDKMVPKFKAGKALKDTVAGI